MLASTNEKPIDDVYDYPLDLGTKYNVNDKKTTEEHLDNVKKMAYRIRTKNNIVKRMKYADILEEKERRENAGKT